MISPEKRWLYLLVIGILVLVLVSPANAANITGDKTLKQQFVGADGNPIEGISIGPGLPPANWNRNTNLLSRDQVATTVTAPALDWAYGCSATSAAMLFGYYDRNGYPNMYTGPTNGGVFPLPTNAIWGTYWTGQSTGAECPLSASHNGIDGSTTLGSVDDYWSTYGSSVDPYYGAWTQHSSDSIADYMGTSQYQNWQNTDGSTMFFYYPLGDPLNDFTDYESSHQRDGAHGMKLFAQSRGYTVTTNYNQRIYGYNGNTKGFTYAQYKAEIDAGHPVLIHLVGHTMLGVGYSGTNEIIVHDTWSYTDHTMTWGGSYGGMAHEMVTVFHLQAASPAPTVSSVSPTSGPTAGGTSVTIYGTGFTGATAARFGGTAGSSLSVTNDNTLTVTSPLHAAGPVYVLVTTPNGTSAAVASSKFTYVGIPTVTSLTPKSCLEAGGTLVTITGTNFTLVSDVMFGDVNATSFTVPSTTSIKAYAPAQTAGTYNVSVITTGGTSGNVSTLSYVGAPRVETITPSSGPITAGTKVTLTGSNFTSAASVTFGGTAGTALQFVNTSYMNITAPAHAAGAVNVLVTTIGGTNTTTTGFTYNAVPTVTGVTPSSGVVAGNTVVAISGTGFTAASTVKIGGTFATNVTYISANQLNVNTPNHATGLVDVLVTTTGGTNAATTGSKYTYVGIPTITSLSPLNGPEAGGTVVTITGTNFTSTGTTIDFGGSAGMSVTYPSATKITVKSPAHADGVVNITVTTAGGTSAPSVGTTQFTYLTAPEVTALNVTKGAVTGGTVVTITGSDFAPTGTTVKFGTKSATTVTYVNATTLKATAPAGTAGNVYITVTTPGGTSTPKVENVFTYVAAPTVTGLSVKSGPISGGTVITIYGTNLADVTDVTFGGISAFNSVSVSGSRSNRRTTDSATRAVNAAGTQLTVTSPIRASGVVDIRVTTPGGTSAIAATDKFTYLAAAPMVTDLSATSGPAGGGTIVYVTGTDFTGATAVKFNTTTAAYTVINNTYLKATSPAGYGIADIRVTTPSGTSAVTVNDKFSYVPGITSLSPTIGSAVGGTTVTITGTGFTSGSTVKFGAGAGTGVTYLSATSLRVTSPAGTGVANVTVTTPGGTSPNSTKNKFTYTGIPIVSALSATSGPAVGGTIVTITGSNFTATGTTVKFNTTAATAVTVVNTTAVKATSPAGFGIADVRVTTTNGGTSPVTAADQFSYVPGVTGITPTSGSAAGGTNVTINGNGFTADSIVRFCDENATAVTYLSATQLVAVSPAGTPGSVDITVNTTGGTSTALVPNRYLYIGQPMVEALSVASGPAVGGTVVTVSGSNFSTTGTTVKFNATAATAVTYLNATSIRATSPAGFGIADVRVTTTNGGTSPVTAADQFSYVPSVTLLAPISGPALGGTVVTITGTGFTAGSTVKFGASAGTGVSYLSATSIKATSPAGTGVANVTVTTPGGMSVNSTKNQFTYIGVPTVTGITPAIGPANGGTPVTITGTGFVAGSYVKFGGINATATTVTSGTKMTATSPLNNGTVHVTVISPSGTSTATSADAFTYAPTVISLSQTRGKLAGGDVITITGTGFNATSTTVKFGAKAGTGVSVASDTSLTATSPSGIAGTVDVLVTTPAGTSTIAASDKFMYVTTPTVTAVTPRTGKAGATITVTGANLDGATSVLFGALANTTDITVNSAGTSLTVAAPAHTAGIVDVRVVTPGGTSTINVNDGFTYTVSPEVTGITPTSGSTTGGTVVTITGTGLSGVTSVRFGDTVAYTADAVTSTRAVSSSRTLSRDLITIGSIRNINVAGTSMTISAPAHAAGIVDVTVATAGGSNITTNGFTYVAVPTVTGLNVTTGSSLGGTAVLITGTGFTTATDVLFGTDDTAVFTVVNATAISVISPAHDAGEVDVTVRNAVGTSATTDDDVFTFS